MRAERPRGAVRARNRIAVWLARLALIGLVVAVPAVLVMTTGNPLAHWSVDAARRSLTSSQSFDSALASHWLVGCAVALAWIAWVWMTICVALEVRSWATGRSPTRLPASRTVQAIAACLVGTALAMSSMGRTAPRPLIAAVPGSADSVVGSAHADGVGRPLVGGLLPIIEDRLPSAEARAISARRQTIAVPTLDVDRSPGTAKVSTAESVELRGRAESSGPSQRAESADERVHRVRPRETLWSIAADRLGSARRWREIAQLNYGATQFDGAFLTHQHWIVPGWVLRLPAEAEAPSDLSVAAASSPGAPPRGSEASREHRVGDLGTHCPIVDTPGPHRDPWTGFPERVGPIPRPGDPFPAVPLGGGIVGAGVVDLVDRLRRIQQRHREDGSFIKLPDRLRLQFERRLRAGEGASAAEAIDGALHLLASSWDRGARPAVRGARILPDTVELLIDLPEGAVRVPSPFVLGDGFLRVDRGLLLPRYRRWGRSRSSAPVPTLVTAGTARDGVVLVDLESLGSLVVSGDPVGCENVIRALALELATSHWSGRFDVVLVGFGAEFERFERVTSVSDPQPLVLELCHRRLHGEALRKGVQADSFAAARWFDDDARWAPLVVVCGPGLGDDALQELLEVGSDPLGGTAVVAVGHDEYENGAAHSVRLTGGSTSAPLELLAAVLTPQQVDAGEFAEVAAILDVAEEKDSAAPSEGPYRDLQVPLPSAQPVTAASEPMGSAARAVPFDRSHGVGGPTAQVRVRNEPEVANKERYALDVIGPGSDLGRAADLAAPKSAASLDPQIVDSSDSRPELREVEVLVLGPVEIRGASREFTRAWAKELVVYLAMHPRGASNEAWATALWPDRLMAPSSLHSTASVARRALGRSLGGIDHLPRAHGRLNLGPTVGTDWERFVTLADDGRPARWRLALELVRGRPFEGLRASDWPILEGIGPAIESSVVDLSGRLAGACLRAGDARGAEWSARKGLLVSPYDERLYRMLLRAADLAGNPAGVEAVMAELVRLVAEGVEPLESVHPSTLGLYRSLTRRRAVPRSGSSVPRSGPPVVSSGPSAARSPRPVSGQSASGLPEAHRRSEGAAS
jgi:DNA-binding SARP family transcriptional activator